MSNETANLTLGHLIVNLKSTKDVYDSLYALIDSDNDLTENEEYFQDDTLELGYDNEADRIVKEALQELGQPTTAKAFEELANKVFEAIKGQEYFGECELNIIKLSKDKLSVAFITGG
jgi:hypothetical protein